MRPAVMVILAVGGLLALRMAGSGKLQRGWGALWGTLSNAGTVGATPPAYNGPATNPATGQPYQGGAATAPTPPVNPLTGQPFAGGGGIDTGSTSSQDINTTGGVANIDMGGLT